MPLLPNYANAQFDLEKLHDYCLNGLHPRGRHKAQVFASSLGIGRRDSEWLRQAILAAIREAEAVEQEKDVHGTR